MSRLLRQGLIPTLIGLGLGGGMMAPSQAQFFSPESQSETVIMIGGSPEEWSYYSGYWQQLMDLNPQPVETVLDEEGGTEAVLSPEARQAYLRSLSKKLVVKDLRLKNISNRFGRSQVTGTLTNNNQEAVVIQGINFEILESKWSASPNRISSSTAKCRCAGADGHV